MHVCTLFVVIDNEPSMFGVEGMFWTIEGVDCLHIFGA